MRTKQLIFGVLSAALCWADAGEIRQLLLTALDETSEVPRSEDAVANISQIRELSAAEVNGLLPLAKQCIKSSRIEARRIGLTVFLVVGLRMTDGSRLMEPFVDDLGELLSREKGPQSLRLGTISVLGSSLPAIGPKAVNYLASHLEDKDNSPGEALGIAALLLVAVPTDEGMVHKLLKFVKHRASEELTSGVVVQLGLIKTRNREALAFIGESLDDDRPGIRNSAVDAASRVDRDLRTAFARQLGRISRDPTVEKNTRNLAAIALQQQ